MVEKLNILFKKVTGQNADSIVKLTGDGSNRAYYRMTANDTSYIGAVGTVVEENRAFFALSRAFRECGIDAPEVLAISNDEICYLQEDLGDTTLFEKMKPSRANGVFGDDDVAALCRVMSILPDIQFRVAEKFDFALSYPMAEFNRKTICWDLNYFKYCFLKGVAVEFNEMVLEDEFDKLASELLKDDCNTLLYRDFQSRNVMWHNDRPYFIDFQGARKGPFYYDVASFVGQARAKYTPDVEQKMIDAYCTALQKYKKVERDEFMRRLTIFRVFRLLQNLGTYGYRGIFERKKKFVETIPSALAQLSQLLHSMSEPLPHLTAIIDETTALPRFSPTKAEGLTVDVISFSYHRGIPEDFSGNGGGFVFDCRALHNPGRYEPYKKLTGMDAPVIEFLEKESNISAFLDSAYALVDEMVDTYLRRNFTHIQVCCGCTGGQHRSVYSAEHIAHHVHKKFGVRVNVCHKMQNVYYTLEAERDAK